MDFKIKLAGLVIGITSLYDEVYKLCDGYYTEEAEAFHVTVTARDIRHERERSARESSLTGQSADFADSYLETLAVYRRIVSQMLDHNVWLMHGSAVCANGEAVLFTAPSGVGKTTHTKFWLETIPGTFVINGDKPLLRMRNGICSVCGTPWSGKEHLNRNLTVPLRAICLLERGQENRITQSSLKELYPTLIQQTYRPDDPAALKKTLALTEQMGEHVRFYHLFCTKEPGAARVAYETIFAKKPE